jgi:hypothetical protein
MLSIGKTNPESITEGRSETKVEIEKATCWLSDITEINIPKLTDATINTKVVRNSRI